MKKIWLEKKLPKKSDNAEKTEMDLLGFFNILFVAKHQKIEGDPLGKRFSEKSLTVPEKTERRDPLVSPVMVCYAEKEEKTFLVPFIRPNESIWDHKIVQNF